jgi:hypothetical protein
LLPPVAENGASNLFGEPTAATDLVQARHEGVTCPVSCRHIGAINLQVELNVPRHGAETRRDR